MRKGKTSKKPRSAMTLWVALIVVFMAELLVYSWCRVQYVHTGYEINEARQKSQVLIALQDKLRWRRPKCNRGQNAGWMANLSTETQPETKTLAGWRICQLGRNRRQRRRLDGEFVNRDTTGDKMQVGWRI